MIMTRESGEQQLSSLVKAESGRLRTTVISLLGSRKHPRITNWRSWPTNFWMTLDRPRAKLSWKRIVIADLVVSAFTVLSFILAGNGTAPVGLQEMLLLPLVCVAYGWPASLIFLLLGVPTLFWLRRTGRLKLAWCMAAGAILTALPSVILQMVLHAPRLRFLQMAPFFATVGIGNGMLTWLFTRAISLRSHKPTTPSTP